VTALLLALAAAYGVHLVWTAVAHEWRGVGPGPRVERRRDRGATWRAWLAQAGLDGVRPAEFLAVMATLFVLGAGFVYAVFGGALPALVGGGFAASIPVATYRARRRRRREKAQEAWPRIIEEIRILTGSLGRSVPQALFEAGLRGPDELRSGFEAAQREWLLSTDFSRTVSVLKQRLADPTRTPRARPCSSPTRSAAPISNAGSRRSPRTASRTSRAARTHDPSRPAHGSPAGSCSSSRSAWPAPA
jgi:tight adherence protein B